MVDKPLAPAIKMTPEMKKQLTDAQADFDRAEKAMKIMEDIGMDMKELREKLEWSRKVRDTLLKEFA